MTDCFIVVVVWSKAWRKDYQYGLLTVSEAPTCARWSIQDDTFGWLDSHFFIILWMCERQLHRLLDETTKEPQSATHAGKSHKHSKAGQRSLLMNLDLLDLIVQSADVGIGFLRSLLHLHHCHQGIGVIHQHSDHCVNLHTGQQGSSRYLRFRNERL